MNVMNKASIATTTSLTKSPTLLDLADACDLPDGRRSALTKSISSKLGTATTTVPQRSLNTSMGVYTRKVQQAINNSPKELSITRSLSKVSVSQQKQRLAA